MADEAQVFSCEKCGKEFKSEVDLNRHTKQAHKEPDFKCGVCGKILKNASGLRLHQITHSTKPKKTRNNLSVANIEHILETFNGESVGYWAKKLNVSTTQINKLFKLVDNVEEGEIPVILLPRTIEEKVSIVLAKKGLRLKS